MVTMKKIATVCCMLGILISSNVSAENLYAGIDYMFFHWKGDDYSGKPPAVKLDFGYSVNKYFSVEAMYAFGTNKDEYYSSVSSTQFGDIYFTGKSKVKSLLGAGVVAKYPVDMVDFYGKAGYAKLKYTFSGDASVPAFGLQDTFSDDYSGSGIYYGVGAEINFGKNNAVLLEYIKLPKVDADGITLKTTSINLGYRLSF